MYNNIGEKIKGLAQVIFAFGVVASIILGIIALFAFGFLPGLFIAAVTLILIPFIIWLSTFSLFGFGELISKVSEIESFIVSKSNEKNINSEKTDNP